MKVEGRGKEKDVAGGTPPSSFIPHPSSFPPRLVLSRPDRVGDVILATCCLEPIRQRFPGARLRFIAREAMRPLLEGHPQLDGFLPLPADGDPAPLARALADWQPDILVHLHPDPTAELAGQLAGIPRRLGYRHLWPRENARLTETFPDRRARGEKHEALANFDLLAPLGVEMPTSVAALRPSVAPVERGPNPLAARRPPSPYVVLNPTAHALDLRWPAAHFAALAREIAGCRPDLAVVLVAERGDDPSVTAIRTQLGAPPWLVDLAGQTDLGELAALLHGARALVSRNTGTAHLAAAVGCPLVEIFGRHEPAYGPGRWRSLGDPARTRVIAAPPSPRRFLEPKRTWWRRLHASVPVAEVRAALLDVLAGCGPVHP